MSNLWIRCTKALSRTLDPAERETVLGDLTELATTDRQALKGMLGLVLRRQLGHWNEWQPWFVLVAVVVPVCALLATQSVSVNFFPVLVMWFHYGISYRTGMSSGALLAETCFRASALTTWSWTSAFALGALSRKTVLANGVLFFLLYAVFAVYRGPYPVRALWLTPWWWNPVVSDSLVVLLPAYCGLRKSAKSPVAKPPWLIPMTAWTVTIGGLAFWTQGWYDAAFDNWSQGAPALTLFQLAQRADVWEAFVAHLLTLAVLTGPIVYLLGMNEFSRRRCRA